MKEIRQYLTYSWWFTAELPNQIRLVDDLPDITSGVLPEAMILGSLAGAVVFRVGLGMTSLTCRLLRVSSSQRWILRGTVPPLVAGTGVVASLCFYNVVQQINLDSAPWEARWLTKWAHYGSRSTSMFLGKYD